LKVPIPPFKYLKPGHLRQIKGGADQLRKMTFFMKKVKEVASSIPSVVWPTRLNEINVGNITRLWEAVGPKVYEKFGRARQARFIEISWRTMYNQIRQVMSRSGDNVDDDENGNDETMQNNNVVSTTS
jgi:hypothetical protein